MDSKQVDILFSESPKGDQQFSPDALYHVKVWKLQKFVPFDFTNLEYLQQAMKQIVSRKCHATPGNPTAPASDRLVPPLISILNNSSDPRLM